MTHIRTTLFLVICCLISLSCIYASAHAEGSIEETIDCTDVKVDYADNPNLTREERLRLMDEAFYESLNRFERCQEAKGNAKASAGGSNGASDGNESGSADSSSGGSVASSTMSGTETPPDYPPAEGFDKLEPKPLQTSQEIDEAGAKTSGNLNQANGKVPDDIPSAENDDALAAQIRYAAENEPDPEKSRQLWNEYRKYKGMAAK